MQRSSDRAQFEPVVALVAVLAVSAGLTVYANTLYGVAPGEPEPATAETALDRAHAELRVAGVVDPARLGRVSTVPDDWRVNLTVRAGGGHWGHGPDPPEDALRAQRRVSVRTDPGEIRPGRLRVVVWR